MYRLHLSAPILKPVGILDVFVFLCKSLCLCLDAHGACRIKWALRGQLRSPARDHRLACSLPNLPFSPAQSCDYCSKTESSNEPGCAGKRRQLFKAREQNPDSNGLTNAPHVGQWSGCKETCCLRLNQKRLCSSWIQNRFRPYTHILCAIWSQTRTEM